MKTLLIFTISLISLCSFSQTNEFELLLFQYGKEIKIKNNHATIDKATFQLVYKFTEPQNWSLIAGSNTSMGEAFSNGSDNMEEIIRKAGFGGADSYFNVNKSIRSWNGEIESLISYEDDQHHYFDSIYRKNESIFGVRTVSYLSTKEDEYLVEDWTDSILILATGTTNFKSNTKTVSNTVILKLNLKEIPNSSAFDVKGKFYAEEGKAVSQEGCEGCGNLGSFEFIKNGKEVKFLLSGSDNFDFNKYTQVNNLVVIGKNYMSFTVNSDGTQLIDNKTGTKYNLVTR